jgi:hypothetical protein
MNGSLTETLDIFANESTGFIAKLRDVLVNDLYGKLTEGLTKTIEDDEVKFSDNPSVNIAIKEGLLRFKCLIVKNAKEDADAKQKTTQRCVDAQSKRAFKKKMAPFEIIDIDAEVNKPNAIENRFNEYAMALRQIQNGEASQWKECKDVPASSMLLTKLMPNNTDDQSPEWQQTHKIIGCFEQSFVNVVRNIANLVINMRVECESALYNSSAMANVDRNELNAELGKIARMSASQYAKLKQMLAPFEKICLDSSYSFDDFDRDLNYKLNGGGQGNASDLVSRLLNPIEWVGLALEGVVKTIGFAFMGIRTLSGFAYKGVQKLSNNPEIRDGGMTKLKKTDEKVTLSKGMRTVYKGKHGKKYVKINGAFMTLVSARKMYGVK